MTKEFLPFETVRNDALHLAHRMHNDGVIPTVIYCSLRGGAYMANVISEYYKIACPEQSVMYASVVAHSYMDASEGTPACEGRAQAKTARVPQVGGHVYVEGWSLPPESLRSTDTVMFIDDIFDSGRTVNELVKIFLSHGIPRERIIVVVHDYKCFLYKEPLNIVPDYWCRKIDIKSPADDIWIHYMSHELSGLTKAELQEYYYSEDATLKEVFEPLFCIGRVGAT